MWSLSFLISSLQMMRFVKFFSIVWTMWQGSKWQVFDGESDEVLCTVKEDKLDLKVFRAFNSQVQNQPDYKTKTNNMSLCMPWSLVILHGKEPLAEVCVQKTLCPSNSLFCNTRTGCFLNCYLIGSLDALRPMVIYIYQSRFSDFL
jgi:hypothetical protein